MNATSANVHLDAIFGALADPTRRAILARLADGDSKVADLVAPFHISQPAISRHLKVLERAGLISRSRQATARLSHLEGDPLREATEWLVKYQAFWDERYNQLDELLAALQRVPAEGETIDREAIDDEPTNQQGRKSDG